MILVIYCKTKQFISELSISQDLINEKKIFSHILSIPLLTKGLEWLSVDPRILNKIKRSKFGRPYIPSTNVDFNFSYSGDYIVCAINTAGRVGIDIEKMTNLPNGELVQMNKNLGLKKFPKNKDRRYYFYDSWTKFESVGKLFGIGINYINYKLDSTKLQIGLNKIYSKRYHIGYQYIFYVSFQSKSNLILKPISIGELR